MKAIEPENVLNAIPEFKDTSKEISRAIHKVVLDGGQPTRSLADLLHGIWLGHPLHPVLTDMVIGAWSMASLFDLLGERSQRGNSAATRLIGVGNLVALPTALAGITDFSTISGKAVSTGAAHGLLNSLALTLNILSYFNRKSGKRGRGVFLSSLALGMVLVSGWLGGEMSFRYRVGVNNAERSDDSEGWQVVVDEEKLKEKKPLRVKLADTSILLYRSGKKIYAIGSVCAHDGGPLDEGTFYGLCVECPWHQSVYDLRDGSVVHGPSTYAQPAYSARVREGKIELKSVNSG